MRRAARILTITFLCTTYGFAGETPYNFSVNTSKSGLNANVGLGAKTTGTLIGNYDATTNPTGTRTKPGLFGPFNPGENVPVPTSVGVGLGGAPKSGASGAFNMGLDFSAGSLSLSGMKLNLLATGAATLNNELTFEFDTFRTRDPNSLYVGGIPLTIPIGTAQLTALDLEQALPTVGSITPAGQNTYNFSAAVVASLSATFEVLGSSFSVPGVPAVLPLEGLLTIDGETVTLDSVRMVEFSNSTNPGLTLPQIPFDLPTILPPGEVAHLLLDLTLGELFANVSGELALNATGVPIPEPGSAALLLAAAVGLLPRRLRGS